MDKHLKFDSQKLLSNGPTLISASAKELAGNVADFHPQRLVAASAPGGAAPTLRRAYHGQAIVADGGATIR